MREVGQPCAFCRQMSGSAPDGSNILSVLLKLTYVIDNAGRLEPASEQRPLVVGVRPDVDVPKLLEADTDLYPFKVATDVVLAGHVYGDGSSSRVRAAVRVGGAGKSFVVVGDRRCTLSRDGRVVFSEPRPVEAVPLRYDRAYGGRDRLACAKYGNPYDELRKYVGEPLNRLDLNPFDYPRNPAGRGFLVEATRDALESLELPNFEDPLDPLGPNRLVAGSMGQWPRMPLPQGLSWIDPSWFPRIAYFGMVPAHDAPGDPIAEVERGFAPADILDDRPLVEKFDFRCANGASLGLQLPYLAGNEEIELQNLHPRRPVAKFHLPGTRPRLWTDGRKGKLNSTEPVIHTVLVEPDKDLVSVLWRGSAPALRPYLDDELATMPLLAQF